MSLATLLLLQGTAAAPQTHSTLTPHGPYAQNLEDLWWLLFWVSTAVYVGVVLAVAWAIIRSSRRTAPLVEGSSADRTLTIAVGSAAGLTAVILIGLLVASTLTGLTLSAKTANVSIDIIGHQWWWEVRYDDKIPSHILTTANEIHIPVGEPVELRLTSQDVVHSFWVPALQGKRDLIPGHPNTLYIQADEPGTYPGQCAEFCGYEHAKMSLLVIAEPRAKFLEWQERQRTPSAGFWTPAQAQGKSVFLRSPCVMCHTIRGTDAAGTVGPDLTHLASRQTIASATLPNDNEHRSRWIQNAQSVKPGCNMPAITIPDEDLQPLLQYLGSLR